MPAAITIQRQLDADLWPVNADRTQLHQLLMNLAVNARDAMAVGRIGNPSHVLTLSTANQVLDERDCAGRVDWRPGEFVVLAVSDTGTGMTPEVEARLFEPFFTTKKLGQGTGLGLAMVFGIVKAHQGWITVTTAPSQGSLFRVYLPAAAIPIAELPEAPPGLIRGGHECILVVDDEPLVCKLVRAILERWGFQVLTAADGEEALALYQEHSAVIDLVLLDFAMPGLTGLQVLGELQKIDPEVQVVFSSGHILGSDTDQLLAAGARAFLAKPYRPEELVGKIRQVLDERALVLDGRYVEASCGLSEQALHLEPLA